MSKLIPLRDIPSAARASEGAARRALRASGTDALAAARYEIHDANGCYGGAYPTTRGWTVTEAAAEALAAEVVRMPGGSVHHDLAYSTH